MMPEASADFSAPACYVHLCLFEDSKYVINRFFMQLMSVLSFYRKRTALPFESILGGAEKTATTLQGYWYTTSRNLVEIPDSQVGKNNDPLIVFDVFYKNSANLVGRFSQCKWSDGYIYQVIPSKRPRLQIKSSIEMISVFCFFDISNPCSLSISLSKK